MNLIDLHYLQHISSILKFQFLIYEKEKGIGIVSINRPESLNALNEQVYNELYEVCQEIQEDQDVDDAGGTCAAAERGMSDGSRAS